MHSTTSPRPSQALSEASFSRGTIMRIGADISAVVAGLAAGALLGFGSLLWSNSTPVGQLGLFAILVAILATTAFVSFGIYSDAPNKLGRKFARILMANAAVFAVAAVIFMFAGPQSVLSQVSAGSLMLTFLAAFAVSSALLCMARMASSVVRSEQSHRAPGESLSLVAEAPQESKDNNVLVIGGSGYIGSALAEKLLDRGMNVRILDAMHFGDDPLAKVIDNPNLEIVRADFRNIEALTRSMQGIGSVIHLGGLVGDPACAVDTDLTIDVNVTATKLVGEIAKACGVRRLIMASSCSVYGACDDIVDETSSFNPQSLYARSKVASEAVLGPLNDDSFAVTCLRFATVYGISGRTRFDLVVNLLCAKAVRDGKITVFGPEQWRPFVHVDDVAKGIVVALEAPIEKVAGEAFNVGSNAQNYTLGQLAELIKERAPDAEIVSDDFPDKRNYRVSFDKITNELGYEPSWTLEMGIEQALGVVRSNQVGHYAQATYSNVLFLKEAGPEAFDAHKITGWEDQLMSLDRIEQRTPAGTKQSAAA